MSQKVPYLLNIKAENFRSEVNVKTSILDPVVANTQNCRFVLAKSGMLHSNAKIEMGFNIVGQEEGDLFLPLNIGVYAAIKRCVLKVGNTILSETNDFNQYMGYRSTLIHPEKQLLIERILTGRSMYYGQTESGRLRLANGQGDQFNIKLPKSDNLRTSPHTRFQIELKELFPLLQDFEIPLFMLQEQVSIELFFDKRFTCSGDLHCTDQLSVDPSSLRLIADYIYYPEEDMENYRKFYENEKKHYVVHQLVKTNVSNNDSKVYQRNLGGSNKVVNKVCIMNSSLDESVTNINTLNNRFTSLAPNKVLGLNLIYNDQQLYTRDLKNRSLISSMCFNANGIPLYIPLQQQTLSIESSDDSKLDNLFFSDLDGMRNYVCLKLNKNKHINSKGIELVQNYELDGDDTIVNRVYLELKKYFSINNGIITSQYLTKA